MPFHNIESYPGSGPVFTKAAGTYSTILRKGNIRARIILPSERHFALNLDCLATYGICSNKYHRLYKKYKAGTNRLLNKRPVVRGVAMNPIDHPHGGGEGKGRPGRPSVSP
jgi:large subunit ribosomal protein L2